MYLKDLQDIQPQQNPEHKEKLMNGINRARFALMGAMAGVYLPWSPAPKSSVILPIPCPECDGQDDIPDCLTCHGAKVVTSGFDCDEPKSYHTLDPTSRMECELLPEGERKITMSKYYCGIGSRSAPVNVLLRIAIISVELNKMGYILRSGAAPGCDEEFEKGARSLKEIYLPWQNFNEHPSLFYNSTVEAYATIDKYHPNPSALTPGARKLMARNAHQVLGLDMKTPVEFVVCWTVGGELKGGTAQAMKIAMAHNIPIYNISGKPAADVLQMIKENHK